MFSVQVDEIILPKESELFADLFTAAELKHQNGKPPIEIDQTAFPKATVKVR